MNFATIAIVIFITTLTFYLIFLLIGLVGIARNREAQGLDQKSNK
tara:strand:- start:1109 stop:1243 length:135 start_codon:yes stop_codon:yes gene_type:complete